MNGSPTRSQNAIREDCVSRILESENSEQIEAHVQDALNEFATGFEDRLDRVEWIVRNGGSFGLTDAQKRIITEELRRK